MNALNPTISGEEAGQLRALLSARLEAPRQQGLEILVSLAADGGLRGVDLRGVRVDRLRLSGVDLRGAVLQIGRAHV